MSSLRLRQLAVVLVLTGATSPCLPASAASAPGGREVRVVATAGFVGTTAPPQPLPAQGDLPVARSALGEQARAVVALDLPADASSATVTFRASGQPASSYGTSSVSACRVTSPWQPGPGQDLAAAPAVDCTGVAPVVGPGPWTFDLAPVLRAWAGGTPSLGIALVDIGSAEPAETTFNIVAGERVGTSMPRATALSRAPQPMPAPAPEPLDPAGAVAQAPALGVLSLPVLRARMLPAPPQLPAPTTAALPPQAAALGGPASPLPVQPGVWLLLPIGFAFLIALRRAVSAAADELTLGAHA